MRRQWPKSYSRVAAANKRVEVLFEQHVESAIGSTRDIVVDMTNMNSRSRSRWAALSCGEGQLFQKLAVNFVFEGAEVGVHLA